MDDGNASYRPQCTRSAVLADHPSYFNAAPTNDAPQLWPSLVCVPPVNPAVAERSRQRRAENYCYTKEAQSNDGRAFGLDFQRKRENYSTIHNEWGCVCFGLRPILRWLYLKESQARSFMSGSGCGSISTELSEQDASVLGLIKLHLVPAVAVSVLSGAARHSVKCTQMAAHVHGGVPSRDCKKQYLYPA